MERLWPHHWKHITCFFVRSSTLPTRWLWRMSRRFSKFWVKTMVWTARSKYILAASLIFTTPWIIWIGSWIWWLCSRCLHKSYFKNLSNSSIIRFSLQSSSRHLTNSKKINFLSHSNDIWVSISVRRSHWTNTLTKSSIRLVSCLRMNMRLFSRRCSTACISAWKFVRLIRSRLMLSNTFWSILTVRDWGKNCSGCRIF